MMVQYRRLAMFLTLCKIEYTSLLFLAHQQISRSRSEVFELLTRYGRINPKGELDSIMAAWNSVHRAVVKSG